MPSISGQSVLVIGGSSGIGFSVAMLALAEKMRVVIASSNQTRVDGAIARLKAIYPDGALTGHTCDLRAADPEANLTALLTAAAGEAKLLNHIIMTAGWVDLKPLAECSAADVAALSNARMVPTLMLGKLAPQFLAPGAASSLILTTGAIADRPMPGWTVLTPFATGLKGLVRALALDLAPLRVNLVSPGPTITEMWGPETEQRTQRAAFLADKLPLKKVGLPEEVAEAYIYLMKDTNSTGTCVDTNGGSLLV